MIVPYKAATADQIVRAITSRTSVWTNGMVLPRASQKKAHPQISATITPKTTSCPVLRGKDVIRSDRYGQDSTDVSQRPGMGSIVRGGR